MAAWVLIIILQIALTAGIVSLSPQKVSNILGVQKIAQVEDSASAPPPAPPPPPPAENPPPPPDTSQTATSPAPPASDNPAPAAQEPTTSPTDTAAPLATPSEPNPTTPANADQTSNQDKPNQQPNLFDQDVTGSPAPSENPIAPSSAAPNPISTPNPGEAAITQTQAVLSPDELINSPENISPKSVDEAKNEEEQLTKTASPAEQTNLLITFATDKVKDMNQFTKADDFSSTNFAAQRFNQQVDQAISNLDKLPPKDQAKVKTQLVNFCSQADAVLRTVQLAVPEESEQDLEMARGQCQELNL